MKRQCLLILLFSWSLWTVLLEAETAVAAITKTVAYKLSVTIPEHAVMPLSTAAELSTVKEAVPMGGEIIMIPPTMEMLTESARQNGTPVIIQTWVVK